MQARFKPLAMRVGFLALICMYIFSSVPMSAVENSSRSKTKIQGVIVTRDGDLMKVQEKKSGTVREVMVTGETKINNDHKMGVKALVPGLNVKVTGVRNSAGQIRAKKIGLNSGLDAHALSIIVAQQQEIIDNKDATTRAQASADDGIAKAGAAQTSADQAQSTANQGLTTAQSASSMATVNASGINVLNQRVSDLGNYTVVASTQVHFKNGSARLSKESQASLDEFIKTYSNVNGYVVEIDGYTSSTGTEQFNQTLSDRRAAVVADYLREKDDVLAWRVMIPSGYGETHPTADNDNLLGRAENRRVEVKILVSKGIQNNSTVASAAN